MRIAELLVLIERKGGNHKASDKTCNKAKAGKNVGASAEASCKAQGKLKRSTDHKDKSGTQGEKGSGKEINGKYVKGEEYGGPYPDYKNHPKKKSKKSKK